MGQKAGTEPWIVLLSAFLNSFLTSIAYSSGVIYLGLLETYRESITLTAWLGALFHSVFCLAGPIGGFLTNRFSCRLCVITGSVFSLIGFGASSLTSDFYVLFLTYAAVAGIGQSLSFTGFVIAIGYYFTTNRTLASGIAISGTGLGLVIFPPLIQYLMDLYGLNGTFLIMGAITFHSCILGSLVRPHPFERERHTAADFKRKTSSQHFYSFQGIKQYFQIFRNIRFLCFCASIFAWASGLNTCVLYLPKFFSDTGISKIQASFLMSLFGLGSVFSRILTGLATVNKGVDGKLIYFGSYGVITIVTFLLPLIGRNYPGLLVYSISLGLYTGGSWTLLSQISIDLVGIYKLASAVGIELFAAGIGFLVGPVSASILLSSYGFNAVFIFVGSLFLGAALFGILMILGLQPDTEESQPCTHQNNDADQIKHENTELLNKLNTDTTLVVVETADQSGAQQSLL